MQDVEMYIYTQFKNNPKFSEVRNICFTSNY